MKRSSGTATTGASKRNWAGRSATLNRSLAIQNSESAQDLSGPDMYTQTCARAQSTSGPRQHIQTYIHDLCRLEATHLAQDHSSLNRRHLNSTEIHSGSLSCAGTRYSLAVHL